MRRATMAPVDDPQVRPAFERTWREIFAIDHDPSGLRSEANVLRYRPLGQVIIRVEREDEPQLAVALLAAQVAGVGLSVSLLRSESDEALAHRLHTMTSSGAIRLRLLAPASDALFTAAFAAGVAVDRAPVTSLPELELRHWVLEQSVSQTMHRHGRILRHRPGATRGDS
jgi:RHH-type proline utilization regulon transcriptional repressor/proline dehydrogenase/delta 1-pyrroline-5-carboxylate dehydrogenase